MFASFLSWQNAFNRPVAEHMGLYGKPDFREAFLEGRGGSGAPLTPQTN